MKIDSQLRIRNLEEVIKTLKQGPNFGIHGCTKQDSDGIQSDLLRSRLIYGHYFGVTEKEKSLDDTEFYLGLFASITEAMKHSANPKIQGSTMSYDGLPCLILGIEKPGMSWISSDENLPFMSFVHQEGHPEIRTFGVGHDFHTFCVDPRFLSLNEKELARLSQPINGSLDSLSADYRARYALARKFMTKIYSEIKNYQPSVSVNQPTSKHSKQYSCC